MNFSYIHLSLIFASCYSESVTSKFFDSVLGNRGGSTPKAIKTIALGIRPQNIETITLLVLILCTTPYDILVLT